MTIGSKETDGMKEKHTYLQRRSTPQLELISGLWSAGGPEFAAARGADSETY
jgi:hypothetical protein